MLTLRNPHSVLEALKTRPRDVQEVQLPSAKAGEGWEQVASLAKKSGVRVTSAAPVSGGPRPNDRGPRDRDRNRGADRPELTDGRTGQASALVKERAAVENPSDFFKSSDSGLWLALDCLQDPHNVGAIFRTAAFFGVRGIVITEERSAPLSGTAYDVASGGLEHVPFMMATNLKRALEDAKERGLWILGTSEHANDSLFKIPRDRAWLAVVGNEESGLRRLTQESCDMLCAIPGTGEGVKSLNVSAATAILVSTLASR